jgi:hypothetical protein
MDPVNYSGMSGGAVNILGIGSAPKTDNILGFPTMKQVDSRIAVPDGEVLQGIGMSPPSAEGCFDMTPIQTELKTLEQRVRSNAGVYDPQNPWGGKQLMDTILSDQTYNSVSSILGKFNALTDENLKCVMDRDRACTKANGIDNLISDQMLSTAEQIITKYSPLITTGYMLLVRYATLYANHCGVNKVKTRKLVSLIKQIEGLTNFLQPFKSSSNQSSCPVCPVGPPPQQCPHCEKCPDCPTCEKTTCPDCQTCPTCEKTTCPDCPTCKECPASQQCPDCPTCASRVPYFIIISILVITLLCVIYALSSR